MQRIFIFGSCVSRDPLELDEKNDFQVIDYFSRSSFASAFSETPAKDRWSDSLSSNFQRRQVERDFAKTASDFFNNSTYDILLVDFIDERFNLFQFSDKTLVTLSAELARTSLTASSSGRVILWSSEEKLHLWTIGWKRFVAIAKENAVLDKVTVNKVFWVSTGQEKLDLLVESSNIILQKMYSICSEDLRPEQFIEYPADLLKVNPEHKWGLSPFHYSDTLYSETLRQLRSIGHSLGTIA